MTKSTINRNIEQVEGIVLKSIDFKDRERILTVFTKDLGLISLIIKDISSTNLGRLAVTAPFCQAEFHYSRGRSEIFSYRDSTILHEHHELRKSFAHLEAAGALARALLASQLPGKPSALLYALLSSYLKQIPLFFDPQPLALSFLLKLLRMEGLFSVENLASSFSLSSQEKESLKELAYSRSFQDLKSCALNPAFAQKILDYFLLCIK